MIKDVIPVRFVVFPVRLNEQLMSSGKFMLGSAMVFRATSHRVTMIENDMPLGTTK